MNILIIDAQGGGIGKQLVTAVKQAMPDASVTAVGTNFAATSAMLKAGADQAATGENAAVVACRKADVIVGPLGIAIADSMRGEITPGIAAAVGQSDATRILLPFYHCSTIIAGVPEQSVGSLIKHAVSALRELAAGERRPRP